MKTTIVDKTKAATRGASWRKVRAMHIREQNHCQMCGRIKDLEVHHILPWKDHEFFRLDPNNLITLCRPCHLRFGHFSNWRNKYNPNIMWTCRHADVAWRVYEPN